MELLLYWNEDIFWLMSNIAVILFFLANLTLQTPLVLLKYSKSSIRSNSLKKVYELFAWFNIHVLRMHAANVNPILQNKLLLLVDEEMQCDWSHVIIEFRYNCTHDILDAMNGMHTIRIKSFTHFHSIPFHFLLNPCIS